MEDPSRFQLITLPEGKSRSGHRFFSYGWSEDTTIRYRRDREVSKWMQIAVSADDIMLTCLQSITDVLTQT